MAVTVGGIAPTESQKTAFKQAFGILSPESNNLSSIVADGMGAGRGGSMGRLICTWPALTGQVNGVLTYVTDRFGVTKGGVRIARHAAGAFAEAVVALENYTPAGGVYPSIGVELSNDTSHTLDFSVRVQAASGKAIIYGGSIRPTGGALKLMTLSKRSTTGDTGWNFATPDQITLVRVAQRDNGPNGAWVDGDALTVGEVFANIKGRPRFMFGFDDVPANAIRRVPLTASTPASGRSAVDMLDYYRFKGNFYLVPNLMDGAATNIKTSEALAIKKAGHTVGSHSATHPIDAVGAGLRLLGPYGYRRSLAVGNLTADCRVISATASNDTFTCEAAHNMSTGGKLEYVTPGTTPGGFQASTTYYFIKTGAATFKLATTAGNANAGVAIDIPADWVGTAEWRWPGSAPDDSAIKADIKQGIDGLTEKGMTGHELIFALPQGGWDHYVRSAVESLGIRHTRGIASPASNHRSIHLGYPTGGAASSTPLLACGWPEQQDAMTSDQGATLVQLKDYVDDCIAYGYTGANYHHSVTDSPDVLDGLMAYVRTKVDAGLIDVVTVEEMFRDTRLW